VRHVDAGRDEHSVERVGLLRLKITTGRATKQRSTVAPTERAREELESLWGFDLLAYVTIRSDPIEMAKTSIRGPDGAIRVEGAAVRRQLRPIRCRRQISPRPSIG
jgi:hypothetical protein